MKKFLQFIIVLYALNINAQQVLWDRSIGQSYSDIMADAILNRDNNIILAASSLSFKPATLDTIIQSDFDYLIVNLDQNNNMLWSTVLGTNMTDIAQSISQTLDLGYIIAGTSTGGRSGDKTSPNIGQDDIWILKMNNLGAVQWQKTIGGNSMDRVSKILVLPDGTYLIAGNSESGITDNRDLEKEPDMILKKTDARGSQDYWIIKLDQYGNKVWEKTYGGIYFDELRSVAQTDDRGFILAGISNSTLSGDKTTENEGYNDWWVIKIDGNGNMLWQKSYGDSVDDQLYAICKTSDNTYILAGNKSRTQASDESDFIVMTIDNNGNILGQSVIDEARTDILTNMAATRDGSIIISGFSSSYDFNQPDLLIPDSKEDYLLLKINSRGEEIWRKSLETASKDILAQTLINDDGAIILAGTKANELGGDLYIVKLFDPEKLLSIAVLKVVPNPASNQVEVSIPFEFKEGTAYLISINGEIIQKSDLAGKTSVSFNIAGLPDAAYLISVKTDARNDVVKFVKASSSLPSGSSY